MGRDGTIYGQVSPRDSATGGDVCGGDSLLRSVECGLAGRMGHPLDAEHVSVLLRAKTMDSPVEDWRAVVLVLRLRMRGRCAMRARSRRRRLWMRRRTVRRCGSLRASMARFLSEAMCTQGCGGDPLYGDGSPGGDAGHQSRRAGCCDAWGGMGGVVGVAAGREDAERFFRWRR